MATQRIYIVTGQDTTRLVKATIASQAVSHVAKGMFTAKVASQDDLVAALGQGVQVESYKDTAQQDLDI